MTDTVELTLPVHADLIVLARFAAATIASRADFDVEEIEDFRLAVEELCLSVVDGSSDGRIEIQFLRDEEQVEVACAFLPGPGSGTGTGTGLVRTDPTPSDGTSSPTCSSTPWSTSTGRKSRAVTGRPGCESAGPRDRTDGVVGRVRGPAPEVRRICRDERPAAP